MSVYSPDTEVSSPDTRRIMDDSLYFTEHHHQVREMVRDFSRSHIAPVARELDRTSEFPWDNIKAMGELGLLGVPWSEELGGAGMDQLSYYITIHEMAKVDASHALTISAHTNLGTSPIVDFGTVAVPFAALRSFVQDQDPSWFERAGFESHDVHMTDLLSGRRSLAILSQPSSGHVSTAASVM